MSTETSDALGGQAPDDGDDAPQLLRLVDPGGAGPGGLAADVDQVGALGDQVEAVLDGGLVSNHRPPSEKESGVTLTTPMTAQRSHCGSPGTWAREMFMPPA